MDSVVAKDAAARPWILWSKLAGLAEAGAEAIHDHTAILQVAKRCDRAIDRGELA
jgi:hypothetical protein